MRRLCKWLEARSDHSFLSGEAVPSPELTAWVIVCSFPRSKPQQKVGLGGVCGLQSAFLLGGPSVPGSSPSYGCKNSDSASPC